MNLAYGSTMSPPRLQQLIEITDEWFEHINPRTDQWFQLHLPMLIEQMGLRVSLASDDCAQVGTRVAYEHVPKPIETVPTLPSDLSTFFRG